MRPVNWCSTMGKRTAVIICPGRGTYNRAELGYINTHHASETQLLDAFDNARHATNQTAISDLDNAKKFDQSIHTNGENASPLIFSASLFDARSVMEHFDVLAVTGNSMGWYTALAVGGAVTPGNAFKIVNTMGTLMHQSLIGGQTIYPFVDEMWREIPGLRAKLLELVRLINARDHHDLYVSIHLGGMLVVAGNTKGLDAFEADLPAVQGRYPMRLPNHAAFHTLLQEPVAQRGRGLLDAGLFSSPEVPLVDGRGAIWYPKCSTPDELRDYTLDTQVVTPYDFTRAVTVAARSFAPDVFVVTGPGATLGSAVAQSLIAARWRGLQSKEAFQERQKTDPVILSMGRAEDRARM